MKKRTLLISLFLAMFCAGISETTFAETKPVRFHASEDSVYHDTDHPRQKIPSRVHTFPYVEYDSDNNSLTFESTAEQLITYYIEQQNRSGVQDGELQLRPNVKTAVYLSALCPDEECCLYIWINGILYVGEIK